MTTPYLKARELGHSDEEIAEHISKKDPEFKAKYEKALQLNYSPEEIISKYHETTKAKQPSASKDVSSLGDAYDLVKTTLQESKGSEYVKTALKGTAEGVAKLGRSFGPLITPGVTNEQHEENLTKSLDELVPTPDEGFGQKALRRGLKEAPTMAAFPGAGLATVPRSIAAGFLGEGAKELGLPEWAQSALELTAFIGPDIAKKLLTSGKDAELIAFAKKRGMTDAEITPLIQSEFKQKWLAKLSPKRGGTQEALKNTKSSLDRTYSNLQGSSLAKTEISEKMNGKLINGIKEKLNSMPRNVREKIEGDLEDLLSNKITGESLINFWKDINANLSGSTKELSLLKGPVKEALASVSPELAKDFGMLNDLYSRFYPIAKRLKPNLASDIISAVEVTGLIAGTGLGLVYGDYNTLIGFLGKKAGQKVAQQMLINPRFQQLAEKTTEAIKQNKFGLVQKLMKDFKGEVGRIDPKAANEIPELTQEEFSKLTNQQKTAE